jgi:hypothetical protein
MSKGASIRVGSSEPENAKKIEGQRSSFGGTARKSVTLIHVMFHFPRKFPGNSQENPRKIPGNSQEKFFIGYDRSQILACQILADAHHRIALETRLNKRCKYAQVDELYC